MPSHRTQDRGPDRQPPALLQLATVWKSVDLQDLLRAERALSARSISDDLVSAVLNEAMALLRSKWPNYRGEPPAVVVGTDDVDPYVSVRLSVPASAEEASVLTWELQGRLIEKRMKARGLTVAFSAAEPEKRSHAGAA